LSKLRLAGKKRCHAGYKAQLQGKSLFGKSLFGKSLFGKSLFGQSPRCGWSS